MLSARGRASEGTKSGRQSALNAKRLICLLAFPLVVGGFAACGSGATTPSPPPPPPPPQTFTFSGNVRTGGAELSGVRVRLSGDASASTVTDSRGTFSFADVSGNSFAVTPSLEGFLFTPPAYQVGAASRADLNFTAARTRVAVGDTAPDFTAVDQNGQNVSLYSYRGKVVFVTISSVG